MSYNSAIPQASDPRALSQIQINANFNAINTVFGNNHFVLTGSDENQGMHTVLTLRPQSPAPTTGSGQIALYNALVSSIPALFFRPQSAATPVQLTYPTVGAQKTPTFRYYSYVAGPFVIYAGFVVAPTNGQVITLSPSTTLIYAGVNEGSSNPSTAQRFSAATTLNTPASSFTINYLTGGTPVINLYFIAIGKP